MNKKMVSFRMSTEMQERIKRISKATRLKKTTILEMCVEIELPHLEKKYAKELAELDELARYPTHGEERVTVGEKPNSAKKAAEQFLKEVPLGPTSRASSSRKK